MPGGRTRTFDVDVALDLAVELFWRQGYEGTSIADLTAAMGIAPPSLYAAFGNKRELFRAATDRYLESRRHYLDRALAEPTARLVARRFLIGTVEASTLPGRPQGCLTVQAALACSDAAREIAADLAQRRRRTRTALQERFERGLHDGDMTPGTDCSVVARYVTTVAEGINVAATGGASRDELMAIVDRAVAGVPGRRPRRSGS
jgi:AcrR family transcriptional regulator